MLATGGNLNAILKNAQIDFVKFIAELFLFHEFILFPISADDVAALVDIKDAS